MNSYYRGVAKTIVEVVVLNGTIEGGYQKATLCFYKGKTLLKKMVVGGSLDENGVPIVNDGKLSEAFCKKLQLRYEGEFESRRDYAKNGGKAKYDDKQALKELMEKKDEFIKAAQEKKEEMSES